MLSPHDVSRLMNQKHVAQSDLKNIRIESKHMNRNHDRVRMIAFDFVGPDAVTCRNKREMHKTWPAANIVPGSVMTGRPGANPSHELKNMAISDPGFCRPNP